MPDHHDLAAFAAHARHLDMDLGNERTGRIEDAKPTRLRLVAHRARHAVGREHHRGSGRDVVERLDEHRPLGAKIGHDMIVVDDLVANVEGRPVLVERTLDDRVRAVDTGAETARLGKQGFHGEASVGGRMTVVHGVRAPR